MYFKQTNAFRTDLVDIQGLVTLAKLSTLRNRRRNWLTKNVCMCQFSVSGAISWYDIKGTVNVGGTTSTINIGVIS